MTTDLPDLESRIAAMIGRHASLVISDDEEEAGIEPGFPLEFITHGNVVVCTAKIYERFNGTVVLRLDAEVCEVGDSVQVLRWLGTRTGWMPFVQARVERIGARRLQVFATHSFLADEVTEAEIAQAIGSIDHVVEKWTEALQAAADEVDDPVVDSSNSGAEPSAPVTIDDGDDDEEEGRFTGRANARITMPGSDGIEAVLAELEALIGLAPVKRLVRQLTALQQVAKNREQAGLKAVTPSPHLVFTGNPGTGKTTVARLVGRLYKELGLLGSGHVVEVDRSGLVAGYVGQTALKTREVLQKAKGGVLFIDEAYTLVSDHRNDYGSEAIETILAHMENNRGQIAVVVAGYPAEMATFLEQNPGLASRFDHTLDFPDFSDDELVRVLEGLVAEFDYELTPEALDRAAEIVASWPRHRTFGNAREVRRLFNHAVAEHASAMVREGITSGEGLRVLLPEHLPGGQRPVAAVSARPGYL